MRGFAPAMNILKNRYFILGNILLLLAIIPLTLYVVKRQTSLKSKAAPTTNLSFKPDSATAAVGSTVSLDVMVDPGQNVVSIVEFTVQVDPDKMDIVSLEANALAFPVKLRGPTINNDGTATISLSTSNDVTKAIQAPTKVATLTLKAKAPTTGAASIVKFNKPPSQAFSLATSDGATENVLAGTGTTSVTITGESGGGGGGGGVVPTPIGGAGGGISPAPSASKLSCTLTLDKSAIGITPYTLTFTAAGSTASSSGIIKKVSFNFGDSTTNEATSSGGIGTNTVNMSIAHTYNNSGTFNASATLTDNLGSTNDSSLCSKTITVSSAAPTPTQIVVKPNGPTPTLPVTGNLETTLAVLGLVGTTIAVGLLLFAL